MVNLGFITIWSRVRQCGTQIKAHSHHYHELVYYISGGGETMIDGKLYTFQPNDLALIPENIPHSELHLADTEVICLGFSCDEHLSPFIVSDNRASIDRVLKNMLKESSVQLLGYREMIEALLLQLYVQLLRLQKPTSAYTKSFSHIISYLAENYHEKIRLSACAEQLGISYDYFQHRFKQITGESPQTFLLNHRLNAAKELLKDPDISCTDIAFRCGFSTSAQFSMLFRRTFGITPHQYRKALPHK